MDKMLVIWFSFSAVSVIYVAYDLIVRTPEMKAMKWGWILVTLYTGVVGAVVYIFSCREPSPGTHEKFVAPLWKQTVGSTIHCMAGDATGVIVVAFITALLNLHMGLDSILEYFAGFAFGLFIFQALFMKGMFGGSYWMAVQKTFYPEWMSMNFVMAGMIPVMVILMTNDMTNMKVNSLRFWGIMSLASLVGGIIALPVNWWLVKNELKHGMGTERALGKGGQKVIPKMKNDHMGHENMAGMEMSSNKVNLDSKMDLDHGMAFNMGKRNSHVSLRAKVLVAVISIIFLCAGIFAASRWGDLSMKPDDQMKEMQMK